MVPKHAIKPIKKQDTAASSNFFLIFPFSLTLSCLYISSCLSQAWCRAGLMCQSWFVLIVFILVMISSFFLLPTHTHTHTYTPDAHSSLRVKFPGWGDLKCIRERVRINQTLRCLTVLTHIQWGPRGWDNRENASILNFSNETGYSFSLQNILSAKQFQLKLIKKLTWISEYLRIWFVPLLL